MLLPIMAILIGYEDLIQNKLSTGRMKDKVDARTLEKKTKKNRPK